MGFCPNCGSWVDEGDVCGFCGGSHVSGSDESSSEYYSSGGFRNSKRDLTEHDIELITSSGLWALVKDGEVFREINTFEDASIYNTLADLELAISRTESGDHCRFIGMGFDSETMKLSSRTVFVKFFKKGKYVDILIEKTYSGGEVFDDGGWKFYDDRLSSIPEFQRLVSRVTGEGLQYNGIYASDSQRRHSTVIETDDFVVLEFEKDGFYFKYCKFNIPERTCELFREKCDVYRIFDENRPLSKQPLLDEIARIESAYNCTYEKCSYIGPYLLFNCSAGGKLICEYDGLNERLDEVMECTESEFESDSFDSPKRKYMLGEPQYWDPGIP